MWCRGIHHRRRLLPWTGNLFMHKPWVAFQNPSLSQPPTRFLFSHCTGGLQTEMDKLKNMPIIKRFYSTEGWINIPIGEIVEVPLAQTGEGIAECELLKWFVREGDHVEEFQQLCEVQSDKATIEITSRYKGTVSEILFQPGDIVKVGEILLKMLVEQKESNFISATSDGILVASCVTHATGQDHSLELNKGQIGVLSTPSVRNLAEEYGLDIHQIPGTGKDGRVLKQDVLKFADSKGIINESVGASVSFKERHVTVQLHERSPVEEHIYEDKTIPLRGFQRAMVKTMSIAAKVPHFYYLEEICCDAMVELKASFQKENTDGNIRHTYLPFLIKSLSVALSKYPLMNSTFNEDTMELVYKGCHNIGVAMATPYGLVVPIIKKVQFLSVLEITKELARLQELALNNKLSPDDISGGTITISNIGAIGGKFGCPLLNLPEVAIIAIGRIRKHPRFAEDGSIYAAPLMNISIGADHRVVDGATVSRFCNEWKLLIEKPQLMFLHTR